MKVYALTLNLVDDARTIEEYKDYHRNPWPEPLQGLREVGITDMKIFLLGRRMFMYMTAVDEFDPDVDFPRYIEQNPRAAGWDEVMRTFHERVPEAKAGEWWALMEQVFDLQEHV